jgi:hypothetical protein
MFITLGQSILLTGDGETLQNWKDLPNDHPTKAMMINCMNLRTSNPTLIYPLPHTTQTIPVFEFIFALDLKHYDFFDIVKVAHHGAVPNTDKGDVFRMFQVPYTYDFNLNPSFSTFPAFPPSPLSPLFPSYFSPTFSSSPLSSILIFFPPAHNFYDEFPALNYVFCGESQGGTYNPSLTTLELLFQSVQKKRRTYKYFVGDAEKQAQHWTSILFFI